MLCQSCLQLGKIRHLSQDEIDRNGYLCDGCREEVNMIDAEGNEIENKDNQNQ
jgi:hypothetical protein